MIYRSEAMCVVDLLTLNRFLLQMESELFPTFIHVQTTHFVDLKYVIYLLFKL